MYPVNLEFFGIFFPSFILFAITRSVIAIFSVRIRAINDTVLEIKLTMNGYVFDDKLDDIINAVEDVMKSFPKQVDRIQSIDVEDGITER